MPQNRQVRVTPTRRGLAYQWNEIVPKGTTILFRYDEEEQTTRPLRLSEDVSVTIEVNFASLMRKAIVALRNDTGQSVAGPLRIVARPNPKLEVGR